MKIKSWALEDRPREKLYQKGPKDLTSAELLAIILGSGTKDLSALDLARKILEISNGNLDNLAKLEINELCAIKGVGPAKAITIKAVLELGARREDRVSDLYPIITSPEDVYDYMYPMMRDLQTEEFWIILLKNSGKVIKRIQISNGGVSSVLVDVKVILRHAILNLATGIILIHNHPSGNLKPSKQDIHLTAKVLESARQMDISVRDHIIISSEGFYSFMSNDLVFGK